LNSDVLWAYILRGWHIAGLSVFDNPREMGKVTSVLGVRRGDNFTFAMI
jgi:hypothetical protein